MEEIRTEEQMKEIQEAITYYHELLERNEMLEKRNQTMLKKIRQEKRDKLKAELCCKIYAIIAVVATIFGFWNGGWKMPCYFLTTMGLLKKVPQGLQTFFGHKFKNTVKL